MSTSSTLSTFIRKYLAGPFITLVDAINKITWKQTHPLTQQDLDAVKEHLIANNLIILTFASNRLSAWFVLIGNFITTGKLGTYAHCLFNAEGDVLTADGFKLIEATPSEGVGVDSFSVVFATVNKVALLKPKSMSLEQWQAVIKKALSDQGKSYDTLFDFSQDQKLSCIELVRNALQAEPNYATDFANFEALLAQYGELTPNMIRDCPDFEVIFEVAR